MHASKLLHRNYLGFKCIRRVQKRRCNVEYSPIWLCQNYLKRDYGSKVLTMDTINPHIPKIEYAVRGELAIRAVQLEKEMLAGDIKPFVQLIKANIGDAQAMGQPPITWIRQVVSTAIYPQILDSLDFPDDVRKRTCTLLKSVAGRSVGAYTQSAGIEMVRVHVAEFIHRRDCVPACPDDIILFNGASEGIKTMLKLFVKVINCHPTGIMVCIPQYPLYTASFAELGIVACGYYLNEDSNWNIELCELERSFREFATNTTTRGIVVINPGNPTGQVLTRENIEMIIKFAHEKGLLIFADEVYQFNINDPDIEFFSFKKVLVEMGAPYCTDVELISFFSVSKGYMGECGFRGGYAELVNIDPSIKTQIMKMISANLCPNVIGQLTIDAVVAPPLPCDPSYPLFRTETNMILDTLQERALFVYEAFSTMPGFTTNKIQGAMYGFPRMFPPKKAIEKANEVGIPPDQFYCLELLEATGICVIPGSGFGQFPGTFHLRTTILPRKEHLKKMLRTFRDFNEQFIKTYS